MGQRTRKDNKKAGERDKKSKKSKEEKREKKAKKREKKAKKKLKRKERALGEGAEGRVLPSDGVTETRGEETGGATEGFMSRKDKDATDSLVGKEKVPRTNSMANRSRSRSQQRATRTQPAQARRRESRFAPWKDIQRSAPESRPTEGGSRALSRVSLGLVPYTLLLSPRRQAATS